MVAKLTNAQVEHMIAGLTKIKKDATEFAHAKNNPNLNFNSFRGDIIGNLYIRPEGDGRISERYRAKFLDLFGFAPDTFDSGSYVVGLTTLQVKLTRLFTSNVTSTGSITVLSWVQLVDKLIEKLNANLDKRQENQIRS